MARCSLLALVATIAFLLTGCARAVDAVQADAAEVARVEATPHPTPTAEVVVRVDAPRAPADAAAGRAAAAAVAAFGADLYRVRSREAGNLLFSPYSAAVALAMTRAGAAGRTAKEMDAVLHAPPGDALHAGFNALEQALATRPFKTQGGGGARDLELGMANRLWGHARYPFEAAFLDRLGRHYGAGMQLVDYETAPEAARLAINQWVAGQTRDRIRELVPVGIIDGWTRLVLTNAIYLKAPWAYPFARSGTAPGPFHRLDGSTSQAQLMQLGETLRYGAGPGYEAVELPYVGGALSMVVIVPDRGKFQEIERGLDAARLGAVVDGLSVAQVTLRFPRFTFRSPTRLKDALGELGMPTAFTEQADFSGISRDGERLFIEDVVHEAFIAVDEQGTEAAAATAVVARAASGGPDRRVQLTVDRPFLFFIRDRETGALLFLGRVLDPNG